MYIDKKSLPEHLDINIKTLTELLIKANNEYDNFQHLINYNNEYLIGLEFTWDTHKSKGFKFKVTDIRRIYSIDNNTIFSYPVSI